MDPKVIDSIPAPARLAIERAANATGVDFPLLVETARRESSFNPSARAPTSTATGLFQFIESTWLETVRRHGAKHGLGIYADHIDMHGGRPFVADARMRQQILDLRFDPELSARMGAELARENANGLERRLGRSVTPGEVYAAHVMGVAGAARLIAAAEQGAPSAAALFPREAAANQWLFMTRDGQARSARQLMARFAMDGAEAPMVHQAAVSAPATPPVRAAPRLEIAESANISVDLRLAEDALRLRRAAPPSVDSLAGLQNDHAAAMMMVRLLIDATRARALELAGGDRRADSLYASSAYQKLAS
jgi:hypothetical protein